MKTDDENNEWKAEAPYLASLQKVNPFIVPENYFDTLPDAISNSVYFDELKQTVPASGFTVPDNYFVSLQDRIQFATTDNTGSISEPLLDKFPVNAGYSTPDQYFQKLQSRILAQTVDLEGHAAIAPTLGHTLTHSQEHAIAPSPEHTITSNPEKETKPKTQSKIVRLWHSGLLKYASAACFIVVAAFGLYLNQQNFSQESTSVEIANEQMLYDIDEQDIIDHVEGSVIDEPKTKMTKAELETYILNNYSQNDLSSEL